GRQPIPATRQGHAPSDLQTPGTYNAGSGQSVSAWAQFTPDPGRSEPSAGRHGYNRRHPMSRQLPPAASPVRVLGVWSAVARVMGNMIGSGAFLLPSSLATFRGLSLVGWLLSSAGAVALALVLARLARQMPAAGGLYAYTRVAFGDVPGFLIGWGYWLSTVATLSALAVAFVGYLDPFVPSVVRAPGAAAGLAVAAIWILVGVNAAGVRTAGRMQVATLALKLLPLAIV